MAILHYRGEDGQFHVLKTGTGGIEVYLTGTPNGTVTYKNTDGSDTGEVVLDDSGLGMCEPGGYGDYTFTAGSKQGTLKIDDVKQYYFTLYESDAVTVHVTTRSNETVTATYKKQVITANSGSSGKVDMQIAVYGQWEFAAGPSKKTVTIAAAPTEYNVELPLIDVEITGNPNSIVTYKKDGTEGPGQTVQLSPEGRGTVILTEFGSYTFSSVAGTQTVQATTYATQHVELTGVGVTVTTRPNATINYTNNSDVTSTAQADEHGQALIVIKKFGAYTFSVGVASKVVSIQSYEAVSIEIQIVDVKITTRPSATVKYGKDTATDKSITTDSSGKHTLTITEFGTYTFEVASVGDPTQSVKQQLALNDYTEKSIELFIVDVTVKTDKGGQFKYYKQGQEQSATTVQLGADADTKVVVIKEKGTYIFSTMDGAKTQEVVISDYTGQSVTLISSVTSSIIIDSTNSDPEKAVKYAGDASSEVAGWDNWKDKEIFKDIRPCVVKDGQVQYYLRRNDYTAKVMSGKGEDSDDRQSGDGTANLTGTDGDIMVEIPKVGYKLSYSDNNLQVDITNEDAKDGYCYRAHSLDAEGDCDFIYVGAYLAYKNDNKLTSVSGQIPTGNITINNSRIAAAAAGTGYQQLSWYVWTLLQCLYLVVFKNLNSQTALGYGYTNGNSSVTRTGGTNSVTFCGNAGNNATDGKHQVKCLGIEDFWGNAYQWCDGIFSDSSRQILTDYNNFNDTGAGYRFKEASGFTSDTGGYFKKAAGTNVRGFLPENNAAVSGGSATTYFSDNASVCASRLACVGGNYGSTTGAGAFLCDVSQLATDTNASYVPRLIFKHKAV